MLCILFGARSWLPVFVIEEHPDRRRVLVFKLSRPDCPQEGNQKTGRYEKAEADKHDDHRHYRNPTFLEASRTAVVVKNTTVIELRGMRIAARIGESSPRMAIVRPAAL